MFDFFKKKPSQAELALEQITSKMHDIGFQLDSLRELNDTLREENKILQERISKQQDDIDQSKLDRQALYDSPEPWIEIVSSGIDDSRGMRMDLDWNKAFINMLTENGITAPTDEEAVRLYLALLYQDTIDSMQDEISQTNNSKLSVYQ